MRRIDILALVLAPLLAISASCQTGSAPTIDFSIYAPPQKDSPVQIVRFDHTDSDFQFVLSNKSEKRVVGVAIGFVEIVPPGCSMVPPADPYHSIEEAHAGGFKVSIAPHGEGIADKAGIHGSGQPGYPALPRRFVHNAKRAKAGYMQVQVGITGVLFQDGTSWPANVAFLLREDFDDSRALSPAEVEAQHLLTRHRPFDDSLVDAEIGKCANVSAAANALQSVEEVVFDHERTPRSRESSSPARGGFSCSLQSPKAICKFQ